MKQDNLKRNLDGLKASSYMDQYLRPAAKRIGRSCRVWTRSFNKNDPEVEFLPAALEVLETPPSPAGRATALLICTFFAVAIAWSYFGTVDIIATATGKIIPTGRTKIIQPMETGVVRAIHVQDGQQVKAGDVLVEIDTTISEAEQSRLQKELVVSQLEAARLRAALKMSADPVADFIAPEGASSQQIELQRSQLISQVQEIKSKLTSLDNQIAQNEGNRAAVAASIEKLTQSLPMLQERSKMRTELSDKGYGSKLDTLTAQQDLVEHEQELQVQQGRLAEAAGGVASLQEQRRQAEAEFSQKNLDSLAQAEQKGASLQQQLVQATQKYRLQTLTAPVDGTVQQLAIHTEGGVVTPAQALLAIVPKDSKLEIEAMVSNRDIGFIHEGQEAEIKVDTFNFTKYGFIDGKVLSISQDAITQQKPPSSPDNANKSGAENETSEPKGQELVYATRVSLDKTQMQVDDRLVNLSPGMAVTVEIKTGTRRVMEYLLSPLFKHKQEALRER
ncbi:MAG: HlyD family type I secretion periplasmic adaptor subunit [Pseudomonadota bacterium]